MISSGVLMTVIQPGVMSIPVDGGRKGTHRIGLTTGGPLDRHAFYWANRLCNNSPSSTCIEVTVGGLSLHVEQNCQVAITGAEMPVTVNGQRQPKWQTLSLNSGDQLVLGQAQFGMRCYLAVAGGFDTPEQFGSTSAVPREKLGGCKLNGSGLRADENLHSTLAPQQAQVKLPSEYIPHYSECLTLRYIKGYQQAEFKSVEKARFNHAVYSVSERMDRMGVRLEGEKIACNTTALKSEGITQGAIQLPPDGQPIIMLNDRQTIGGYPKLGSVLSLDCDFLAQARPGTAVTFSEIDMFTAHNLILLEHHKRQRCKLQKVC